MYIQDGKALLRGLGDVRSPHTRTREPIDENDKSLDNLKGLLESEGAMGSDVVCTTCYLRDIDRDYDMFNDERTLFSRKWGPIRCLLRQPSRRTCAARNSSSRSKL